MKSPFPWLFLSWTTPGLLALFPTMGGFSQGISHPTIMRTGSGDLLSSETAQFEIGSFSQLSIDFGFATTETVAPNLFYDSLTVSISGPGGVAYLATADATGVQWAPQVPGALTLPGGFLDSHPTSFRVSAEGSRLRAFHSDPGPSIG